MPVNYGLCRAFGVTRPYFNATDGYETLCRT